MKYILSVLLWICLVSSARGELTNSAVPPRFVILVDTSASMGRKQVTTFKTIRALVRGGFDAQAKPGDRFAIWTFGETLRSDFFPAQQWFEAGSRLSAEVAVEAVHSEQHHGRSHPAIYQQVTRLLPKTNGITVIIISDQTLKGTPFDAELTRFYAAHSSQILRERKAFVISFAFEETIAVSITTALTGESVSLPVVTTVAEAEESNPSNAPALSPQTVPENTTPLEEVKSSPTTKIIQPALEKKKEPALSIDSEQQPQASKPAPLAEKSISEIPSFELAPSQPKAKVSTEPDRPPPVIPPTVKTMGREQKSEAPEAKFAPEIGRKEAFSPAAKSTASAPFFGFANLAWLTAGGVILLMIGRRIVIRSSSKDPRSLITRSMDVKR